MRKLGAVLLLSMASFGILTMISITGSDSIALAQTSSEPTHADNWASANFAQKTALQEQVEFSRLAKELETKITERDTYLTGLLESINANPPTEGTGGESFTSECVIATAAYGSNLAPQVQFLRNFRDDKIESTAAGSSFIQSFNLWYYSFSPSVAEYERGQPWLQHTVRLFITPLLAILQLSENGYSFIDGEPGALVSGAIASSLIGMVYFSPLALVALSRKRGIMTKLITFLLIAAGVGLTATVFGIFLELSGILMVATSVFVISLLAASAILIAKYLRILFELKWLRKIQQFDIRPRNRIHFASAILMLLAIVCSQLSATAFASAPSIPPPTLSREEIEGQLTTLGETKSWLEETRRIESFFADTEEVQSITSRLIDLQTQYVSGSREISGGDYAYALQYASDNYQKLSSKVYNDGVADRHFTLKDTLSSAILQLHYSTADEVNWRTCDACDADQAQELFQSSQLALETSTLNFYTYSQLVLDEGRQIQSRITDIDLMPS
jgi:hypothetical protein